MYYQKVKTKHFYRLQKTMGLGHQLIPMEDLAVIILTEKGKNPGSVTKNNARRICVDCMKELGIISYGESKKLKSGDSFVYIIQQESSEGAIKIGISDDIDSRMKSLQTASPYKLKLLAKIIAKDKTHALYMEKSMHEKLKPYRLSGEWFSPDALRQIKNM